MPLNTVLPHEAKHMADASRQCLAGPVPRGLLLRTSAFELLLFAGLYFVLFLATGSLFILGGMVATGALSLSHYRLARRHDARPSVAGKQRLLPQRS